MLPQLKTLLPLLAVFSVLFLVAWYFLTLIFFGKYGHSQAIFIDEVDVLPIYFTGKAVCIECNENEVLTTALTGITFCIK